jgi:DNA-binding transcriptional ArsR family regulator
MESDQADGDRLSTVFAALADPTRRAILARLTSGEATVTELAEPFAMSLPAISRHLKVLEHAGLISRGRSAQWRPCRLEAAPLGEASDWLDRYRRFWEDSFGALADHLRELQQQTQQTQPAQQTQPDEQEEGPTP